MRCPKDLKRKHRFFILLFLLQLLLTPKVKTAHLAHCTAAAPGLPGYKFVDRQGQCGIGCHWVRSGVKQVKISSTCFILLLVIRTKFRSGDLNKHKMVQMEPVICRKKSSHRHLGLEEKVPGVCLL